MNLHGKDSTNAPVQAGDRVRFRGRITTEVPDEISIDRIVMNQAPKEK